MKILIENEYIKIVYTEKQNIPFVIETEQSHENAQYIGQWSYTQHKKALNDKNILHLIIKDNKNNNIGYAIIRGLENSDNNIELMRIVITKKGCGYGKSALSLIQKWCFETKNAHRFWLDVRQNNIRAQQVYIKSGFLQEGVLRECIKDGNNYQSLIVMSILSHEYMGK